MGKDMTNPQTPPQYRSRPHRENTAQTSAPQPTETVVPTWSEGDDLIVTLPPAPTKADRDAQKQKVSRIMLQRAWDEFSSPQQIKTARLLASTNAGFIVAALIGGVTFYSAVPTPEEIAHEEAFKQDVAQNDAKKSRLQSAYYSVADLDTTLPNTAQVVRDIRALPEGNACWAKYTSVPTDSGTVQAATLHKCLGDEFAPFLIDPNPVRHDDTIVGAALATIVLIATAIAKFDTRRTKANHNLLRDTIVCNPEYNGQPLPGPFKTKQPTLKLDKD